LRRLHWQLDQLAKPDDLVAEGGSLWNYGYSSSTNDPPPWYHFFKTNTTSTTVTFDIVGSLTNRYEVMSYAAQSYTTALGATPGVHKVAANVDLTTQWHRLTRSTITIRLTSITVRSFVVIAYGNGNIGTRCCFPHLWVLT